MNNVKTFFKKKVLIVAYSTNSYIDFFGRVSINIAGSFYARSAKVYFITNTRLVESFPVIKKYAKRIYKVKTKDEIYKHADTLFDEIDICISDVALCDFSNQSRRNVLIAGFTIETENLRKNAEVKLEEKNMDIIFATSSEKIESEQISSLILSRNKDERYYDSIYKMDLSEALVHYIEGYCKEK